METRIAIIGIIVENTEVTEQLNAILHEYGNYIVGRDAPQDEISSLSGKLGMLPQVSTKTVYSKA